MLNIGRVRPPMPLSSVTMVGAISSTVYCIIACARQALHMRLGVAHRRADRGQPLGRVLDVGAQRGDDEADGVAGALVVLGPHRHRDAGGQRLVRQAVAFEQEAPQRAAAEASTTSLSVQPAASASARSRAIGNCCVAKRRFSRTRPFSTDSGASKGSARPSPRSPTRREHLAEGGQQLRRRAQLAAQRLRRRGHDVGHRRRRRVALAPAPACLRAADQNGGSARLLAGVGGHRLLQHAHAADAVDQRMVHLHEQREAAAAPALR